ncbi:acyl carrier protein [Sorangium sp. So ce1000]|uniref:acyl carrier protein n=1 Tax=Sorangium sp. So ce1000 TaxID=3133325 RepID=UPI003F638AB0
MTREALRGELKAIIADLLEIGDFRDDDHFIRDLRADSMLLEELVARVEKHYRVSFPNEKLRGMRTLNDVVRVTSELLNVSQ